MRNFSARPVLALKVTRYLATKTARIEASANPEAEAASLYKSARQTKMFDDHIIKALAALAGMGQRCMFCGGSEASQVEHFWPKGPHPKKAMTWDNFIWSCGVCNQNKGTNFPLSSLNYPVLINPIDEDVWSFFLIDEFGILTPKWDRVVGDINVRAKVTDAVIKLNRQAVQEARQIRLLRLREDVLDTLALYRHGDLAVGDLRTRMQNWLQYPFHPEVAQYFLVGEGRITLPFLDFLALV